MAQHFRDTVLVHRLLLQANLPFKSSNFGYQEAISDPANFGKILAFTTPMIGGSGINAIDYESIDPSVRGIIANDIAFHISANPTFQDLNDF